MINKIARLISFAFHPLLMPSIGLFFILNSGTYISLMATEGKWLLFLLVGIGTLILPLSFIPIFSYLHITHTLELDAPRERVFPLLVTSSLYFLTYIVLRKFPIEIISNFILVASISVAINLTVNLFWKVSSHMIGMGGLTGILLVMMIKYQAHITYYLILVILIAGLVGFARLQLQKHTPAQVYTGFFIGLIIVSSLII